MPPTRTASCIATSSPRTCSSPGGEQAKVMDFGLAMLAGIESGADDETVSAPARLTEVGTAVGTVAYMSPEQARGEPIDARSDVFSFGAMLYEMTTGVRPFAGSTSAVMFDALLNREPLPPRALRPEVPAELDRLICRALVKNRDARLQSAAELLGALKRLKGTAEAAAPQDASVARRPRLTVPRAAVAALVLAVVAGLVYWTVARPGTKPIRSLAILPFDSRPTGVPDESFGGLAATLTDDLARAASLRVVPHALTAAYQGTPKTSQEIGRELGADAVLRGTVSRAGDTVRVDAALVDTASGRSLWSRTYQQGRTSLFEIERDVARGIADTIGARPPAPDERPRAEEKPSNPEAYELYLRGRYRAGRWNEKDTDEAIALLERSTALDPEFGPSQALLGYVYGVKSFNYRPDEAQWIEKGYAAVEKALALDPASPYAHLARGRLLWRHSQGFPHLAALAEYRQSLAARPNFDEAWHERGIVLFHVGHLDAGRARRAAGRRPQSQQHAGAIPAGAARELPAQARGSHRLAEAGAARGLPGPVDVPHVAGAHLARSARRGVARDRVGARRERPRSGRCRSQHPRAAARTAGRQEGRRGRHRHGDPNWPGIRPLPSHRVFHRPGLLRAR